MKFIVSPNRTLIHDNIRTRRHVGVHIVAPEIKQETPRSAANLAFVLDRSGSMSGGKFELARQAAIQGIERLTSEDMFSVVVFDDHINVVHHTSPATPPAKRAAIRALRHVRARGMTDLGTGWLTGCGQVAEQLVSEQVGRCLLLTDGLANQGMTDGDQLARHATELRSRGVSTSTFGLGEGFDEFLLRQMADAGGGTFTFIEGAAQIPSLLNEELGETLQVVARDVMLDVKVPAGVQLRSLAPYPEERTSFGRRYQLPDLVSRQDLEFPIEIDFDPGEVGETVSVAFTLRDRDDVFGNPRVVITWSRAGSSEVQSEPSNRDVDRLVAEREASTAREEAARLNRDHRYHEAERRVRRTVTALREFGGDDEDIQEGIDLLLETANKVSHAMDPMDRKQMHARASSVTRGGEIWGKGRKVK